LRYFEKIGWEEHGEFWKILNSMRVADLFNQVKERLHPPMIKQAVRQLRQEELLEPTPKGVGSSFGNFLKVKPPEFPRGSSPQGQDIAGQFMSYLAFFAGLPLRLVGG
jgi:hypothetical protein